jgi:broad specificity phosphatase PhoE
MSLILYFLRHGQTACSRDNLFCGAGMEPELTPEGLRMAEGFQRAYRSMAWRAIFSSPQKRALATASAISGPAGLALDVRDALKEIAYGEWEGKSVDDVRTDYPEDHARWSVDPAWNAPTQGETAFAVQTRVVSFVQELQQRWEEGNVLIISHKATIRILLCNLLGIDISRFRYRLGCPVGSVTKVELTSQGPLLHFLADRNHMDADLCALPGT